MDIQKIKALQQLAKTKGPDMTKATGGGDYTPPAAGPCQLRFVSYIEVGKQAKVFKGVTKVDSRALLVFEISGPNHPPMENGDPQRITIDEKLSMNEKANFYKLFGRMNYAQTATHVSELLGDAFLGVIHHRTYKDKQGKDRIAAELRPKGGAYEIMAPRFTHPVTGVTETVNVQPAKGPLRLFLWDFADAEQWASIFIEGQYEERKNEAGEVVAKARSKNVFQDKIKQAKNFTGSPIHALLVAAGQKIDIPEADSTDEVPDDDGDAPAQTNAPAQPKVLTGTAATDALNDIVPA